MKTPERLASVDLLRGVVMIIMALDHTRDYVHVGAMHFQPENLEKTTAAIFFTRWITHFCAPVFMFCAGLGAWFWLQRRARSAALQGRPGADKRALSRFLVTRGLWLLLLEFTVVRAGFYFHFTYDVVILLVFWALGMSMIALAALIHLPWRALAVISVAMIALHNLADGVRVTSWIWNVLHQPGVIQTGGPIVFVAYPLVPWIGVMAAGFCLGRIYDVDADRRSRLLIRLGIALTVAFVVIRVLNIYGDPRPWSGQPSALFTVVSFLNTTKYPPSLLFLLMTLGPALALLGWIDRARPSERNPLLVFGRVPLFYFALHIPLIHAIAIALTWFRYGAQPFLFLPPPTLGTPLKLFPADYGWSLGVTYVVWIAVVVILYPVCLWFSRVKSRGHWWASYL